MRRLRVFVLAAFALAVTPAVLAQSYPSRPVKVIVPFPPGDAADILSRLIMKLPDVSEKMIAAGLIIVTEPPEFFGDMIRSDYAKYGKLARDIGFKPQ